MDDRDVAASDQRDSGTFLEVFLRSQKSPGSGPSAAPLLPSPIASRSPGLCSEAFTLALTARTGLTVRYSLDGSDPSKNSGKTFDPATGLKLTTSTVLRAVATDEAGHFSPIMTAAYLFPASIPHQQRPPQLPALCSDTAYWSKLPQNFTIPFQLSQAPATADLTAALAAAPIVVLTAPFEHWFDAKNGIYANSSQKGPDWKKTITVSALCPADTPHASANVRTAEATVAISGSTSRYHDVSLKHSFRIKFQDSGVDLAPVFGNTRFPCRELVLRNPTHDSWTVGQPWQTNQNQAKYLADAWADAGMGEAGHLHLQRAFVHVFLNGLYWGIYEAIEQQDPQYLTRQTSQAAVEAVVTDLLEGGSKLETVSIQGNTAAWYQLTQQVETARQLEMVGKHPSWEAVRSQLDVPNLIDYILWNCWLANQDWPQHNYLMARIGTVWHFLSWDAEFALQRSSGPGVNTFANLGGTPDGPAYLFRSLATNADFRAEVLARWQVLTQGQELLAPAHLEASFNALVKQLHPLMAMETARWGYVQSGPSKTVAQWERNVAWVSEKFIPGRTVVVESQLRGWLERMGVAQSEATRRAAQGLSSVVIAPPSYLNRPIDPNAESDRDGDGIPDAWEVTHGLNADDADAGADPDQDGMSNWEEYLLNTNPGRADDASKLRIDPAGQVFSRFHFRKSKEQLKRPNSNSEIR